VTVILRPSVLVMLCVGDGDTSSAATLSRLDDDGARNRQRPTQFQQSQLCQAVTAAVYADIHSSELKAKNVIITGLAEAEHCTDGNLVSTLFSGEFGEHPTIVHSQRLGKPRSTTGQKPRPLLVSFDSSHTSERFVTYAKVLRNSTNAVVRYHVYINKDLTKAQAQAAYELRCKRRAAAVRRRDKHSQPTPSSEDLPVPSQRRRRDRDRQPSAGL